VTTVGSPDGLFRFQGYDGLPRWCVEDCTSQLPNFAVFRNKVSMYCVEPEFCDVDFKNADDVSGDCVTNCPGPVGHPVTSGNWRWSFPLPYNINMQTNTTNPLAGFVCIPKC